MIIVALLLGVLIFVFAARHPAACFSMGFPVLLFAGQIKAVFPISVSAASAFFPLAATLAVVLRTRRLYFSSTAKIMLALGILMMFSLSYSASADYGQEKVILFWFLVMPVVFFAPFVLRSETDLSVALGVISSSLLAFVLASLFSIGVSSLASADDRQTQFLSVTVAGQYFGLFATLLLLRLNYSRENWVKKLLCVILLCLTLILALRTGTRGAILALMIAVGVTYWFMLPAFFKTTGGKMANMVIFVSNIILFLVAVVSILFLTGNSGILERFTSLSVFFSNFSQENLTEWSESKTRSLNYAVAFLSFMENPLTGLGAGGYKAALNEFLPKWVVELNVDNPVYPHNLFLEFASEQGVVGLVLISGVITMVIKTIVFCRAHLHVLEQHSELLLGSVAIFSYGLAASMTSLDIPRMMILWWGIGLVLAAGRITEKKIGCQPRKGRERWSKYP